MSFQNSEKKVQNRWELIEATLLGPIRSSVELQVSKAKSAWEEVELCSFYKNSVFYNNMVYNKISEIVRYFEGRLLY